MNQPAKKKKKDKLREERVQRILENRETLELFRDSKQLSRAWLGSNIRAEPRLERFRVTRKIRVARFIRAARMCFG